MATSRSGWSADKNAPPSGAQGLGTLIRVPAGYASVPREVHDALVFTLREQLEILMGLLAMTASPADSGATVSRESSGREHLCRLSSARVLVVDDDPTQAALLTRRLMKAGFNGDLIEHVTSGPDALVAAGVRSFALSFVDWRMPGMDGLETTRQLRAVAPEILIVGHTADCTREARIAFVAAGADDCVAKPIGQPLMDALVLRWLSASEAR